MSIKLFVGSQFAPINLHNIHGNPVTIPHSYGWWPHLQLRRFAGCPVCNLYLQTFIQRLPNLRQQAYYRLARRDIKQEIALLLMIVDRNYARHSHSSKSTDA